MERIKESALLATAAALVVLELAAAFLHRLALARGFSPLTWIAAVRCADMILFFTLFRILSVPFSTAGLRRFVRGSLMGLGVSLVLGSGFFLLLYAAQALCGVDLRAFVNPGLKVRGVLPLAVLCLLGPFVEEIFFRGLCYTLIRAHCGVWLSVVLSALIFAASHLLGAGTVAVVLVPLMGGVIFALLYEYADSLFAPFALHAVGNFILFSKII